MPWKCVNTYSVAYKLREFMDPWWYTSYAAFHFFVFWLQEGPKQLQQILGLGSVETNSEMELCEGSVWESIFRTDAWGVNKARFGWRQFNWVRPFQQRQWLILQGNSGPEVPLTFFLSREGSPDALTHTHHVAVIRCGRAWKGKTVKKVVTNEQLTFKSCLSWFQHTVH